MSFIKKLFEKRKDIKYGSVITEQPAYQPQTSVSQSEASRLAGEAALARMTNSKKYVECL